MSLEVETTDKRTDTCSRPLCIYTQISLKFLALNFFMFLGSKIFFKLSYATFQCGRYNVKKNLKKSFFAHEKLKKPPKKVAHNRPRPFYSTVQPRPTANSPKLIFHIMKSRDQTSVLLSVVLKRSVLKQSLPNYQHKLL